MQHQNLADTRGCKWSTASSTITPYLTRSLRITLYEAMTGLVFPLCSYLPHSSAPTPVSSSTSIIDLQGVTIGNMWSLRNHLQQASTMATINYPETLNMIFIVNSPSFFPTIWGWIKVSLDHTLHQTERFTDVISLATQGWFDEGTRIKIHVLGREPLETLQSFIDPKNLPKPYGGELDWKFEDEPNLDDEAKDALGGGMPHGPHLFVDGAVVKPRPISTTNTEE